MTFVLNGDLFQLALDPSDDGVALESAALLHRLGRTEEARVRYIQARRKDSDPIVLVGLDAFRLFTG